MAEFVNVHVGSQLQVATALPGNEGSPILPGRDPLCLGVGPTAIPGTAFASGNVLVGSPLSYPIPATPEAALMVARPNVATNPLASKVPSLFKVTTKANLPPTPLDVMLGDPGVGMVGITVNSLIINIINATQINIVSPETTLIGKKTHIGMNLKTGVEIRTGACNETGFKWRAGFSRDAGVRKVSAPVFAPIFVGNVTRCSGKSTGAKSFDIEHPSKEGYRLRHVCVEGPTSDVYVRGRLKDKNVIELPEYWKGLVDSDSITVQLQPIGDRHFHLNIAEVDNQKIVVKEADDKPIDCFYHIYGERKDVQKNIPEYEGESPADYPGDQSDYSIAGFTYDVREEE